MPRAVRFDKYGGLEVLQVVEVDRPTPGPGKVLVRVKAASINPGEASIRKGLFGERWPSTFPSGQDSDLAGIVNFAMVMSSLGSPTTDQVKPSSCWSSPAISCRALKTYRGSKPALFVAGTTAYAAVRSVALRVGDTVVVSGAAGGVGSIAVQLARIAGAKVIGLSSDANHKWLADHGVIPVTYGDGVEDRIRAASGGKADAFIDTFGGGYVELALKLGVAPDRIDTIIDFAAAAKYGVKTEGNHEGATADVLAQLAGLLAAGHLEIPIAKVYPLAEVRDAYRELEQRHTRGKIVLEP
jgi:NADPH:quinone reductase-like Zn-dependent oxidoreductase